MATLSWNPQTMRFESTGGAGGLLAGTIVPGLSPAQQYLLGATRQWRTRPDTLAETPYEATWMDDPYTSRAIQQRFQPTLGSYYATYGSGAELPFSQYLTGINPATGQPEVGVSGQLADTQVQPTASGGSQPSWMPTQPGNWADIAKVAQTYRPGYSGVPTGLTQGDYDRWRTVLDTEGAAEALTGLATYNAPGIFGSMREQALGDARRRYMASTPAATSQSWLGELAKNQSPYNQFLNPNFRTTAPV